MSSGLSSGEDLFRQWSSKEAPADDVGAAARSRRVKADCYGAGAGV